MEELYSNDSSKKSTTGIFRKKTKKQAKPIFTTNGKIRKHTNTDTRLHELKKELGKYEDDGLNFAV